MGRRLQIGVVAILVVKIAGAYLVSRPAPLPSNELMTGTMFVSDAGRSYGGFEYTATWNATLESPGSAGTLNLVLNIGLGDALSEHQFTMTDAEIGIGREGNPARVASSSIDIRASFEATRDVRGALAKQNEDWKRYSVFSGIGWVGTSRRMPGCRWMNGSPSCRNSIWQSKRGTTLNP